MSRSRQFAFLFMVSLILGIGNRALAITPEQLGIELANKATATVSVGITLSSAGRFDYRYTVDNLATSARPIISFNVQLDVPFQSIAQQSPQDWRPAGCCVTDNRQDGATGMKVAGWIYASETSLIQPGASLGGFMLIASAPALPGVKKFFVESLTSRDTPQGEPGDAQEERPIVNLTDFFNNSTSGLTIGPDPTPADTGPVALLDRLIFLKEQSASLGWLRGEEFIKDLDEKLDQAKKALTESKPSEARHKLREFIHKLEEQRKDQLKRQHEASEEGREEREAHTDDDKKFINDNAFYLLKPNAEFIISKLPARPEDKDNDDGSDDHDR